MSQENGWIAVTDNPHPIGLDFVAYYGNGSKRKSVVFLDGKDAAISHWIPLPDIPTIADEYEAMMRVIGGSEESEV